jgi:hypothetical protein
LLTNRSQCRERARQLHTGITSYAWAEGAEGAGKILVPIGNELYVQEGLDGTLQRLFDPAVLLAGSGGDRYGTCFGYVFLYIFGGNILLERGCVIFFLSIGASNQKSDAQAFRFPYITHYVRLILTHSTATAKMHLSRQFWTRESAPTGSWSLLCGTESFM